MNSGSEGIARPTITLIDSATHAPTTTEPIGLRLASGADYFHGYNGLPIPAGDSPTPDRYGGPILRQWMNDLGYRDLR